MVLFRRLIVYVSRFFRVPDGFRNVNKTDFDDFTKRRDGDGHSTRGGGAEESYRRGVVAKIKTRKSGGYEWGEERE